MTHKCHAIGCNSTIPPKLLMCPTHWAMVSRSLQQKIYYHYRPGQEIDKRPSTQYLQAAEEAIATVAQLTVI